MTLAEWVTPEIYNFTLDMKALRMRLFIYDEEMVKLRGGKCFYISWVCFYEITFV